MSREEPQFQSKRMTSVNWILIIELQQSSQSTDSVNMSKKNNLQECALKNLIKYETVDTMLSVKFLIFFRLTHSFYYFLSPMMITSNICASIVANPLRSANKCVSCYALKLTSNAELFSSDNTYFDETCKACFLFSTL